jgi:hypothetical protein
MAGVTMSHGAKIQYEKRLTCKCGQSGIAIYEENEAHHAHPFGYDDRKLVSITGEFDPGTGSDPPIYCRACRARVS